jgi:phospholipase D1/2
MTADAGVEDADLVESVMDGKKYMASRLATTWRRTLMRGPFSRHPYQVKKS